MTVLISSGIDVNAKDSNQRTALLMAADLGYVDIVSALLQSRAIDINIKDDNDKTAIQIANQKEANIESI